MSLDYSKVDIPGLSKQDKIIVLQNEGASIEQLMELGLTEAGEKKLRNFSGRVKKFTPQPAKPISVRSNVTVPQPQGGGVPVYNRRTQQTVKVSPQVAQKLTGKLNYDREHGGLKSAGRNYERG